MGREQPVLWLVQNSGEEARVLMMCALGKTWSREARPRPHTPRSQSLVLTPGHGRFVRTGSKPLTENVGEGSSPTSSPSSYSLLNREASPQIQKGAFPYTTTCWWCGSRSSLPEHCLLSDRQSAYLRKLRKDKRHPPPQVSGWWVRQ